MTSGRNSRAIEASDNGRRPYFVIFKVAAFIALVALALSLIGVLADWSQLRAAIGQLAGEPSLLAILVSAYTLAFLLRAAAWRALSSGCIGTYQLFVSIQAGLLINHLTPVKLGEVARPLLATRYGMPIAEAASTTAVARYLDFAALLAIAVVVGSAVSLSTARSFGWKVWHCPLQ